MSRAIAIRRQMYITSRQDRLLRALAKRTGITVSEHVRRAIYAHVTAEATKAGG